MDQLQRTGHLKIEKIYVADVNAKSTEWHAEETDERGELVEETFQDPNLIVLNQQSGKHTYEGYTGHKSNVDVTATSPNLAERVVSWEIGNEIAHCDHNVILTRLDWNQVKRVTEFKRPERRMNVKIAN